ncbi:MAG: hypothetical protein JST12_14610 [Armatimonadetes bacterium]|nr:hypothetical protein [Armatimonadota bacterium]
MKIKLLDLDQLPRSTMYFYKSRIDYLMMVCVWAAWKWARLSKTDCPTMDAVWGTVDFSAFVFEDTRTGEVRVSQERPVGPNWQNYGEVGGLARETTNSLLSGVNLTGLSVERVLRGKLGEDARKEILQLLPVSGKFQPEFWSRSVSGSVTSDAVSLRKIDQAHPCAEEDLVIRRLAIVVANRSIQSAVKALAENAAVIPNEIRSQPRLFNKVPDAAYDPPYSAASDKDRNSTADDPAN